MIISRTPLRISFFGGGTDYPIWYRKYGGSVISSSINKYIYISSRNLFPFFKHNIRLSYAIVEEIQNINEISHPSIKEILKFLKIKKGIEIHYDGDLPGKSGLGSSSSFIVGLLNCLAAQLNYKYTKKILLKNSLLIEQKKVGDLVGSQDQVAAVYGGLNHIKFKKNGDIKVNKIKITQKNIKNFEESLLLVYTGLLRSSNDIAKTFYSKMNKKNKFLDSINSLTNDALKIFNNGNIDDIGKLLNETWQMKKKLSNKISNDKINNLYDKALEAGALGGKLLGAGGGGFLLLYVKKNKQKDVKSIFKKNIIIPIKLEKDGSKIIHNDND